MGDLAEVGAISASRARWRGARGAAASKVVCGIAVRCVVHTRRPACLRIGVPRFDGTRDDPLLDTRRDTRDDDAPCIPRLRWPAAAARRLGPE